VRQHSVDRGAATVLVVGCCGMSLVLVLGLALVLGAVRGSAQARAAADLSALAAATVAVAGMRYGDPGEGLSSGACAVAAHVAALNGARLRSCVLDGGVNVTVSVAVPVAPGHLGRLPGVSGPATAVARAGPAPPDP